ncbi:MAG: hypothetical protein QOG03_1361, partial [Actinomycetota bacterium]|nr:hypothetical protein [Actinomycetota bacterium]
APRQPEPIRRPTGRPPTRPLRPVPDIEIPHVRLGIAWAVVTFAVATAGAAPLAVWMAVVALAAAGQACRSWRGAAVRPWRPVAIGGAVVLPLTAIAGLAGVGVGLLVIALTLGVRWWRTGQPSWRDELLRTASVAVGIGLAAASPVAARHLGLIPGIVLLSLVGAYDASAYVVGTGAGSPWEGPAAGVAAVFAVTLAVAAVFAPPFRGASPWLLGLAVTGLAPLGRRAADQITGDAEGRTPAVGRLSSLLLAGPVWVVLAVLTLSL